MKTLQWPRASGAKLRQARLTSTILAVLGLTLTACPEKKPEPESPSIAGKPAASGAAAAPAAPAPAKPAAPSGGGW